MASGWVVAHSPNHLVVCLNGEYDATLDIDWNELQQRLQSQFPQERYPILKIRDNHIYIVKFLGEMRSVNTMYGPANAVDVEVLQSNDFSVKPGRYTIFVSQVILDRELKNHQPLTGKTLVVANLGRQPGKRYKLYKVVTPDEIGLQIP